MYGESWWSVSSDPVGLPLQSRIIRGPGGDAVVSGIRMLMRSILSGMISNRPQFFCGQRFGGQPRASGGSPPFWRPESPVGQNQASAELIDGMNAGGRATKFLLPPANEYSQTKVYSGAFGGDGCPRQHRGSPHGGGAKPQPPKTFKPAASLAWVRAELVMQPLSGLERVRAGGRQKGGTARVGWRIAVTHRPNVLEGGGFPERLPWPF